MRTVLDFILKPLWLALAKPGLGNPHSPSETQLMMAGVKPVAIVSARDAPQMQPGIQAGQIVHIADEVWQKHHHVYCVHKARELADSVTQTIVENWINSQHPFAEANPQLLSLYENEGTQNATKEYSTMNLGMRYDILQKDIFFGQQNKDLEDFLEGRILALPPIHVHPRMKVPEKLAEQYTAGKISLVTFNLSEIIQVYAQADKVNEGRELYARYYQEDHSYKPLSPDEEISRVGELLGFTDNDIAYHLGTKYQGPLVSRFMQATANIRQHARLKIMLWDSPISTRDLNL